MVALTRIPAEVNPPLFIVISDQGHTFEQIQNAFYRLVDNSTDAELARYSPQVGMAFAAIAMAEVFRVGRTCRRSQRRCRSLPVREGGVSAAPAESRESPESGHVARVPR